MPFTTRMLPFFPPEMFSPCVVAHCAAKDVCSCLHISSPELCLGHPPCAPLPPPAVPQPQPCQGARSWCCAPTGARSAMNLFSLRTRAGISKDWKAVGRIQCRMQRGGVCQSHPLSQTDSRAVDVGSLEGKCPMAWGLGVSAAVQEMWG